MSQSGATKVAFVTGSSSGIGRAMADRLAASGWRVWGGSRRPPPTTGVTPAWTAVPLDVTRDESVTAALSTIIAGEGRLDALVHCAGIAIAGSVEDVTAAEAQRQLDTNYLGSVRLLRGVLPVMRRQGGGRIVVVGSVGGLIGLPFLGHYSASKFALDGLVEALRQEMAPYPVQVTILHPGDICTDISANQLEGAETGEGSAHAARFRRAVAAYDKAVREARGPEVIADAIERLLARRRQPARIVAGTAIERAGVGLKAVLPRALFQAIVRRSYGL